MPLMYLYYYFCTGDYKSKDKLTPQVMQDSPSTSKVVTVLLEQKDLKPIENNAVLVNQPNNTKTNNTSAVFQSKEVRPVPLQSPFQQEHTASFKPSKSTRPPFTKAPLSTQQLKIPTTPPKCSKANTCVQIRPVNQAPKTPATTPPMVSQAKPASAKQTAKKKATPKGGQSLKITSPNTSFTKVSLITSPTSPIQKYTNPTSPKTSGSKLSTIQQAGSSNLTNSKLSSDISITSYDSAKSCTNSVANKQPLQADKATTDFKASGKNIQSKPTNLDKVIITSNNVGATARSNNVNKQSQKTSPDYKQPLKVDKAITDSKVAGKNILSIPTSLDKVIITSNNVGDTARTVNKQTKKTSPANKPNDVKIQSEFICNCNYLYALNS